MVAATKRVDGVFVWRVTPMEMEKEIESGKRNGVAVSRGVPKSATRKLGTRKLGI